MSAGYDLMMSSSPSYLMFIIQCLRILSLIVKNHTISQWEVYSDIFPKRDCALCRVFSRLKTRMGMEQSTSGKRTFGGTQADGWNA